MTSQTLQNEVIHAFSPSFASGRDPLVPDPLTCERVRLATQEQAAAEAAAEAKAEAEAALEMARLQAEDKESVLLDIVVLYSDDGYVDPPPGYWKVPYDLNKVLQTRLPFLLRLVKQ